ncbi:MAG: hypothetical protein ABIY52_06225 [Gemmatimonadaceae bacterium]
MSIQRYRAAVLTVAAAAGLACGSSDAVTPSASLSGTYRAMSINGQAPPASISENSQRTIVLLGATLKIGTDDHFVMDDTLRIVTGAGTAPQIDHRTGTYVATSTKITFTPDQPGALDVTSLNIGANGTLTLLDPNGSVPVTILFSR